MKVTITNVYSANESFECWNIHFERVKEWWTGDGHTKVQGTATIDEMKLISKLAAEGYVFKSADEVIRFTRLGMDFPQAIQYVCLTQHISLPSLPAIEKTIGILNEIPDFCKRRKQVITKTSHNMGEALLGGNKASFYSAKKKIMRELSLDKTEQVYSQLKKYLKNKNKI